MYPTTRGEGSSAWTGRKMAKELCDGTTYVKRDGWQEMMLIGFFHRYLGGWGNLGEFRKLLSCSLPVFPESRLP